MQQLRITGTVEANYRAAYDILVRPKGSRTALEDGRGLVRPNYLSGLYGGITVEQLDRVRAVGHVDVAAPVAMLGYTTVLLRQTVDLTDQVDRTATRQLFRLSPSWIADRGLTVLDDAPQYVYLTRNQLVPQRQANPKQRYTEYADGTRVKDGLTECVTLLEVEPDGRGAEICAVPWPDSTQDGTTALERTRASVRRMGPDGRFSDPYLETPPGDRLIVTVNWRVMVLVAAIDPVAEAALVDLDKAVVSGRYLAPGERATQRSEPDMGGYRALPALFASTPYVDEQVKVSVQRLGADSAATIRGRNWKDWVPALATVPGTPGGEPVRSPGVPRFGGTETASVSEFYQSGPTSYRTGETGALRPEPVPPAPRTWLTLGTVMAAQPPIVALDNGFRPLTRMGPTSYFLGLPPRLEPAGTFDPGRLRGFSPLSSVPLETYQAPEAVGADAASRRLLGGEPLRPNSNPAGYLAAPPAILTTLDALADLRVVSPWADPISAIRVRVAGVTGFDPRSQELVRSVAQDIAAATGLDVDVTMGSSPSPQTVVLPAGKGGRPELVLSEGWSHKGVAVAIVHAADRKSLALVGLILLVCTLFLGNAVAAAVRDRRRELAVLACLGWPARRLAGVVFAEVAAVGLVSGALASAVALPLSGALGVPVSAGRALLALPVGLGVAVLAAAVPAGSAARARPGAAVHPAVLGVGRARRRRTVLGLALANLWRVPGRTALGVGALAIGVGALTMLVAIIVTFHNDVIGSLLGDEVTVRVRTVDVLAAAAAVGLGVLIVADVLYINVRERSAELAALWAAGWSNRALLRLVGYEGLGIGVLGAVLGVAAGLGGVSWFAGQVNENLFWLASGVAAGAVVVAGLAAVVPALVLRRLPLSTLLAEE